MRKRTIMNPMPASLPAPRLQRSPGAHPLPRHHPGPRVRARARARSGTGLVALLALAVAGCGGPRDTGSGGGEAPSSAAPLARVVNVAVTPVERRPFRGFLQVTGEVEALHEVTVAADEKGTISRYLIPKGSRVRRGQVVAQIDDTVLRATVAEARAQADLAREQFERQRRLWEDERIGTEIAYLKAKYDAAAAEARMAMLETRLAHTSLKSPINGVFEEKLLEAGEYAKAGAAVYRVVTVDPIRITGGVPERYAASVTVGDSVRITFDILPGRTYHGAIGFVGSTVNAGSRTFPTEVIIPNPEGIIKPRMIADLEILNRTLPAEIVVPREVVQRTATGHRVFVVEREDGRRVARSRAVTLGPSSANVVVVLSGLAVGDSLITVGYQMVDDGLPVRTVSPAAPAAPAAPPAPAGTEPAPTASGDTLAGESAR